MTSSGWTRQRRCEYRQTTVQEPWGATAGYYGVITAVQPHIQSFIKTTWDEIEPYEEIEKMATHATKLAFYLWEDRLRASGYMAYLRHHGFPSPMMDWTRSPYIAAFFAFSVPRDPTPERIAIFAYCECPDGGKNFSGDEPCIFRLGPNVRTHRRHHLQQGEYTICLQWEHQRWGFVPHERVFGHTSSTQDQDLLWKLTLPWTERIKVMESLDDHNVNAVSLIESDAALLETLAFRQFSRLAGISM